MRSAFSIGGIIYFACAKYQLVIFRNLNKMDVRTNFTGSVSGWAQDDEQASVTHRRSARRAGDITSSGRLSLRSAGDDIEAGPGQAVRIGGAQAMIARAVDRFAIGSVSVFERFSSPVSRVLLSTAAVMERVVPSSETEEPAPTYSGTRWAAQIRVDPQQPAELARLDPALMDKIARGFEETLIYTVDEMAEHTNSVGVVHPLRGSLRDEFDRIDASAARIQKSIADRDPNGFRNGVAQLELQMGSAINACVNSMGTGMAPDDHEELAGRISQLKRNFDHIVNEPEVKALENWLEREAGKAAHP